MGDGSLRPAGRPRIAPGPRPRGGRADLADLVGGESSRSRTFLRGIVAGALVGAAVVGMAASAVVRRREATRR